MLKSLHPNIRIRIYTSFLSRVIGSMIFPFMAIYFTYHLNATLAGILLMVNVIVQFIASLYGGYLADILGRKRMMVLGEWMKLFAFAAMVLANSPLLTSPWITFLTMIIIGISSGFVNPAAEAMLIDVSTKETRAFMYSINYWAVNLSIMIGLIVGGWFYKSHLFELLIGLFIMSIITLWMTATLIQETYTSSSKTKKEYGVKPLMKSYQTVIKDIPFMLFTLGGIAILSLEFQRNNFIAVRLEEEMVPKMLSIWNIDMTIDGVKLLSLLTVENTIIIVFFTALVSKWIRNKPEQPIMYAGFILFGIGFAILAFSNSITHLVIATLILSIGELLYVPTRQSILADIVDDSRRGAYMAFNGFVFQIGKMFGALGIIIGQGIGGYGMAILYLLFVLFGILLTRVAITKRLDLVPQKTIPITFSAK
ncbi:DHA1 family multidrug resistance protein B-like MFS transporter [Salirhabdus euzebyi]|uniref:DHA1 family multidrug resistance protein B-like MFS transporter n=1 Tax=Salirhabdus euzebyi TaxID=394506 RepID=A0A841QAK5_9BACI|nr:MFS transporter [Salirhabdus euzebyi]MBB6455257.1 DHA1 family multidrug resistance protein B-like MFS transporter [Salirhabdus euzebyi]